MYLRSTLCTVSFLALSSAAFAAPATDEGAARLTAAIQTYLSATPGVVTVTPAGETYTLKLDAAPLIALMPAEGGKVEISPLTYVLTDNGDGTWRVTEDQAATLTIDVPGTMQATYKFGRIVSDGVWDEKLPGFSSQTATVTGFDAETVSFDPEGKEISRSTQRTETMDVNTTGTAAPAGGMDARVTYDAKGISQVMTMLTAPDAPPMNIEMQAADYTGDFTIQGMKSREILDLVGWAVAHPSKEAATAAQDELRGLLSATLPVFKSMQGTLAANSVTVGSPVGTFGAASLTGTIDANGVVSDGRLREAFAFKGVTIPAGLVPDWAAGMVPGEIALDVTVSGFDLAAPAQLLLKSFDLAKDPAVDPALDAQLAPLFMPQGKVDIALAPGTATSPLYTLTYEGQMAAGPGMMPTGTARITAQGLDKVQEELAKAPPEISGQVMMPMGMAMGMAKDEGGTLVWEIDASQPGSLKINGTEMMGGMPQ